MDPHPHVRLQLDTRAVDWRRVAELLAQAGMAHHAADVHERAFNNSSYVVFAFADETLVGVGRALSDGEYQAALYDVAVLPAHQGAGLGKRIVQSLVERTPGCNLLLYATPGKEAFYEKAGFRRLKTAMARFLQTEAMREKGFTE